MKNLLILLAVFFILPISAQKIIEKNIEYNNQQIDLDVRFASKIQVKTWDKSTVYFKADIYTKDDKYLDLYKVNIDKGSRTITIESDTEVLLKKFWEDRKKMYPGKKRYYYNSEEWYEFNYVLYVPKNATFKVSSINGDLASEIIEGDFTADLINGDIDIASYKGDLDLKTINGEIDIKMIDADLVAETIHGDIFADEKLKFTSSNRYVGQKIAGQTASGSNKLRLNTINGNMYLRL